MRGSNKQKITLAEVAERAGVSRSAVSRTFTQGASVSTATRAKVLSAASELGYRPNLLARSLSTGISGLIGVVANNFHNPIYLEVFDLMTRALQALGYKTLLINLTDETDPDRSVELLNQYQVDAVVVASSTLPLGFAEAFAVAGIPTVHAFGRDNPRAPLDVVGIDNIEAGRIAARRLIQCGYQHIGFLGGPERATSTRDRLEGFLDVLDSHPRIKTQVEFAGDYTFEAGFSSMAGLLLKQPAQGYFCADDVISIGAMTAVRKSARGVPKDIGVIGFNNMEIASWENIRLTTVAQPLKDIIDVASARVDSALKAQPGYQPSVTLLPCTVVERDTLPPITD